MSKTRQKRCITTTARNFSPCSAKWSIYRDVLLINTKSPLNHLNILRVTPKRLLKQNSYLLLVWVSPDCSNNLRSIIKDKLCSHNSVTLWKLIVAQQPIRYFLAKCSPTVKFFRHKRHSSSSSSSRRSLWAAVVHSWSHRHLSIERRSCSKVIEIFWLLHGRRSGQVFSDFLSNCIILLKIQPLKDDTLLVVCPCFESSTLTE